MPAFEAYWLAVVELVDNFANLLGSGGDLGLISLTLACVMSPVMSGDQDRLFKPMRS